jgi:hypothetical protein
MTLHPGPQSCRGGSCWGWGWGRLDRFERQCKLACIGICTSPRSKPARLVRRGRVSVEQRVLFDAFAMRATSDACFAGPVRPVGGEYGPGPQLQRCLAVFTSHVIVGGFGLSVGAGAAAGKAVSHELDCSCSCAGSTHEPRCRWRLERCGNLLRRISPVRRQHLAATAHTRISESLRGRHQLQDGPRQLRRMKPWRERGECRTATDCAQGSRWHSARHGHVHREEDGGTAGRRCSRRPTHPARRWAMGYVESAVCCRSTSADQ